MRINVTQSEHFSNMFQNDVGISDYWILGRTFEFYVNTTMN